MRTVRPARRRAFEQLTPPPVLEVIAAIGPQQINERADGLVTVTYPVGSDTVLSMQPDGTIECRPVGACGAFELAVLLPDRLVYAPLGAAGTAFLIPFTDTIPIV